MELSDETKSKSNASFCSKSVFFKRAYGGSAKMRSNVSPLRFFVHLKQSAKSGDIFAFVNFAIVEMLLFKTLKACEEFSTKTILLAPLLAASRPYAPVPANISNTFEPSTNSPNDENTANRAASVAGRVASPFGEFSKIPLAYPAVILIFSYDMKILWVLSIFLLFVSVSLANETKHTLSLFIENDMYFSDRYYTNGLKLQYTNQADDFYTNALQFVLLDMFVSSANKQNKRFQSLSIGQSMYVPYEIEEVNPPKSERPYAGWLYVSASSHIVSQTSLDSLAITLGIVGRHSYAGDLQRWWHETGDFDTPLGWDNELKDEFGFVVSYKHSERVWRATMANSLEFDGVVSMSADLGNVITQGVLSGFVRLGYNLPWTFDFSRIDYTSSSDVAYKTSCERWHLFLQAGANARFVGYDISIDGSVFAVSEYGVNSRWFVCEPIGAISARVNNFQIDFTVTYRTKEFTTQRNDYHMFWSCVFKYNF